MQKIVLILFGAAMTMLLSSCSPGDERNHPLFRKAENAQKTGQTAEAVGFYKELLKRRGNCVYAHLNLATIYDESLNDPQMAALHYRLYLEGNPNAVDAAEVKAWQKNAEKRYYESLQSKFAVKTPPKPIVPNEIKLEIAVDMPPEKPADFKQKTVEIIEKELGIKIEFIETSESFRFNSLKNKNDLKKLEKYFFETAASPPRNFVPLEINVYP